MTQIDLIGKRAVITGGAQGIGRSIAERFLRCGAAVSLWDSQEAVLQSTAQELAGRGCIHTVTMDVSDANSVDAATRKTVESLSGIDILVANAGITGPNLTLWNYPVDSWEKVINVCLNGVFFCCRSIAPLMIKQNYGRIINVASIAGKEGNPHASAYSAAKAVVIALTRSLGKELASYNIAVNCITPAAAKTKIFDQMTQEHIQYMLSKIPRGRFLNVEEIAAMVSWLASEENSFATGAVFDISGGRATY